MTYRQKANRRKKHHTRRTTIHFTGLAAVLQRQSVKHRVCATTTANRQVTYIFGPLPVLVVCEKGGIVEGQERRQKR